MTDGRCERSLLVSGLVLGAFVAVCPLVVRWADTLEWKWPLVVFACGPALLLLGFVILTLLQQHRGVRVTSFEPAPLRVSAYMMSVWVLAGGVLGYFGVLLAVIILPTCAGLVALAWVRPREGLDEQLTVALAMLSLPFVVWFIGRADEYITEGLAAGTAITAIIVVLALLRRRGRRPPASQY